MSTQLPTLRSQNHVGFFDFSNLDNAIKSAEIICKSSCVPKEFYNNVPNVLIAIELGMELGLKPMQAVQNIMVINGRPCIWGDAMLAVCMQSPDFIDCIETFDLKTYTATCIVSRKNRETLISTFSMEDAKKAGLWDKSGTWRLYPKRMLKFRARGFGLRDMYPDILKGILTVEEVRDIKDVNQTEDRSLIPLTAADSIKKKFKKLTDIQYEEQAVGLVDCEIVDIEQPEQAIKETLKSVFEKFCISDERKQKIKDWAKVEDLESLDEEQVSNVIRILKKENKVDKQNELTTDEQGVNDE